MKAGNTLKCANAHSFDIAREGYVNLLLKKFPGDTREMLLARRNFLERGYYLPISDKINELISSYLLDAARDDDSRTIVDAGCGEGYYLGRLKHYLESRAVHTGCYLGVDTSKEAIRMAARRYREIGFVVANLKEKLPLAGNSIQAVLNIFAPRNPGEFARIIAPKGLLMIVIPSPKHLLRLRLALNLLNIEENKQQHVIDRFRGLFHLIESTTLEYEIALGNEEILLIVQMTPNYWHMPKQNWESMRTTESFQTEIGFTCLLFQGL